MYLKLVNKADMFWDFYLRPNQGSLSAQHNLGPKTINLTFRVAQVLNII